MKTKHSLILGIRFFPGDASAAVEEGLKGGLVVVPSAPVLIGMEGNASLRRALTDADIAIADSGYMVLLWALFTGKMLHRVSGLNYLKLLLRRPEARIPGAMFWVMPAVESRDLNMKWLNAQGISVDLADCYVAPIYSHFDIEDAELVATLNRMRPKQVILCVGGGVQERLGWYLRERLDYRPGIHCVGAAIGFLSGDQVRIPSWGDRLYLGWLFRIASHPGRFIPRYWRAVRLFSLIWRFRSRPPI